MKKFYVVGNKSSKSLSPTIFNHWFKKYKINAKYGFLELNIKENISIKDLRKKIIHYVDEKFKGNENYKKIIETSAFCTEDNNIVSDNYKIIKDQKIGIIPPIGGG